VTWTTTLPGGHARIISLTATRRRRARRPPDRTTHIASRQGGRSALRALDNYGHISAARASSGRADRCWRPPAERGR
jgi:hypothetical protein